MVPQLAQLVLPLQQFCWFCSCNQSVCAVLQEEKPTGARKRKPAAVRQVSMEQHSCACSSYVFRTSSSFTLHFSHALSNHLCGRH